MNNIRTSYARPVDQVCAIDDMVKLISSIVNEYPEDDDRRIIAEAIAKKYGIDTSEM